MISKVTIYPKDYKINTKPITSFYTNLHPTFTKDRDIIERKLWISLDNYFQALECTGDEQNPTHIIYHTP